jgi:uncharacterized Fe-S cluster-containing protein
MNKIAKRTAHCLNVSENLIQNSVKLDRDNEKYNNNAKSKTITRKDTIDQFNTTSKAKWKYFKITLVSFEITSIHMYNMYKSR